MLCLTIHPPYCTKILYHVNAIVIGQSAGRWFEVEADQAVAEVEDARSTGLGQKLRHDPVEPAPALGDDPGVDQDRAVFRCRRTGATDNGSQLACANGFAHRQRLDDRPAALAAKSGH